ncbi:Coq4 family protein [Phenylobacterium sp.]|jgi:ubiquinone biosynthesis protein COQ4|uniref:Coq4 family protein n=1 Tax=Phenylobacterium sp. TaxID=1871053 RepID=UPI003783E2CA
MAMAETPYSSSVNWPHALRSLRRLLADKEDTVQVFEIMRAMDGNAAARGYSRLLETAEGGAIAYARREFAERLMDDAWLDSLPAGSVGAAYRDFVRAERLSAQGLVEISQEGVSTIDDPHPYAWFGRRTRDVHDIWHILTGYGRDGLGEACLVAFSYPQTGGLGWALIAVGAAVRSLNERGYPYRRAMWRAYLDGRRAAWLLGEDYEALLAEPLEAARVRLKIARPTIYESIPPERRDLLA